MFEIIAQIPLIGGFLSVVLPFLIVLGVVVAIHEYGHYIVGRWCGIGAEVFSIGFGRVIWSRMDRRGTKWQICMIPLGGYVKFLGDMDAASTQGKENLAQLPDAEASKHFHTASLWRKSLTVLAGPVFNFILSFVIFAGLAIYTGKFQETPVIGKLIASAQGQFQIKEGDKIVAVQGVKVENFGDINNWANANEAADQTIYTVERGGETLDVTGPFPSPAHVGTVHPVSSASSAGLKSGDLILSLDGVALNSFKQLRDTVLTRAEKTMPIVILRDGRELTLTIHPREREFEDENGKIVKRVLLGITGGFAFEPTRSSVSLIEAATVGVDRTWGVIYGSLRGIYLMFAGEISPKNLQGPVGIAHMSSDVAQAGWISLIALIGIVSTAIGFLNLMPIPVLDGGHLIMFGYQALFKKPVSDKFVRIASMVSLTMLLTLMLFSTSNDVIRWFQ